MPATALDYVKSVVIVVFAFGAAALLVVSLLTPWYTFTTTYPSPSTCVISNQLSWEIAQSTCAITCNATTDGQSCSPLVQSTRWLTDCDNGVNFCYWQHVTFEVCRGFTGGAAGLVLLSLLLYFIAFFGKMHEGFAIFGLLLGLLASSISVATLGVGLPMAIRRDYVLKLQHNSSSVPSDTACPQQPSPILAGCASFINTEDINGKSVHWGPDTGWILCLIGIGIILVDAILMCVLGVPKRDEL